MKARAICLGFSVCWWIFALGVSAQPCVPLPPGLVSWWRAESSAADTVGTNNGSIVGAMGFGSGEVGQAFVSDGHTGMVQLGNPVSLQLQNFTIEAWIARADPSLATFDASTIGALFHYGNGGYGLGLINDGTLVLTKVGVSDVRLTSASIADTAWHHIAVTKSGSTVIFYIDGAGFQAPPYNPGFNFTTSVAIAGRGDTLAQCGSGAGDELAVYNHALSQAEIQAIYNSTTSGKCTNSTGPFFFTQPADQTANVYGSASFSAIAGGTLPLTYQWRLEGTNLPGMTNASLTLFNLQAGQAGHYSLQASNAIGVTNSADALLTVNPALPCTGPPGGLVSWWRGELNAQDQVGTNQGALTGNATYGAGDVGQGFIFDGNGSGVLVGSAANLRLQDFSIEAWVQRSSPTLVSSGPGVDSVVFSFGQGGYGFGLAANGQPFLSRIGINSVIAGPIITDLVFHHLAMTKSGTSVVFYVDGTAYPAAAYNSTFTFTTAPAIGVRADSLGNSFLGTIDEVAVYNRGLAAVEISAIYNAGGDKCVGATGPSISVQPQSQTTTAGTNVTFTILAAGSSPLAYQWQFRGNNLANATNYFLNLTNVQFGLSGSYQAIVTNAYGGATSAVATLTIQSPPIINTQPQSVVLNPGSNAEFVVAVSGSPPFAFQWQHTGTNLTGGNSYSLLLTNVQTRDAGGYAVVITKNFGAATSVVATLTLRVPAGITNQPAGQIVPIGSNPAFAVVAFGTAPITYQWRLEGTNLPGATNAALLLNNVQPTNAGSYSVAVSNSLGSIVSSNAVLILTNPSCVSAPSGLAAWWQGESSAAEVVTGASGTQIGNTTYVAGKAGQAFSFNTNGAAVSVGNPTNLQLQDLTIEAWVKRTSPIFVNSSQGQASFLAYGTSGYAFGVNNDGSLFLSKVGLSNVTVPSPLVDTGFHHIAVTKSGGTVVFYVDGVAYPGTFYDPGFTFSTSAAIGARGDNLTGSFYGAIDELAVFNRALSQSEIQSIYYATSKGKCPAPPAWILQPTNRSVAAGSNATFTGAASGSRPISEQWYFSGAAISGATNPSLTLPAVTYFQAGAYSLSASNLAGSILSSNAILSLLPVSLIGNGSFENGNAGWILSDISSPLIPLAVRGSGYNSGFGFFPVAATDGSFCLTDGFDGNGPGRIRTSFDVILPPSPVTMTFSYRAAWDMQSYGGSTKSRSFSVVIEPSGGGAGLQTNIFLTADPGTANYDTGNLAGSVDLAGFSGRGIRVNFDQNIPESFTGPGFFQLDNIVLSYPPVPPFLISRSGTNVILSWPVAFSSFAAQVTTNLLSPAWTSISTNLNVRGPTNTSLTQPATSGSRFYRLKSL
ncbi:MAG: hypothetical protein QOJ40_25 [Verrucomicrobiota bacterium]